MEEVTAESGRGLLPQATGHLAQAGDMGGIICGLDIGGPDSEAAHLVSITHLTFHRRVPLSREIEAYQRHRIKKLRQQQTRGY